LSLSPAPNPAPEPEYIHTPAASSGSSAKFAVLFGAIIALLGANVYLYMQVNDLKTDLNHTKDALSSQLAKVQEIESLTNQTHQRTIESLRDQLEAAKRQASMAAGQAKLDAIKRSEELAAQLAREQRFAQQQLTGQITEVKEATNTAQAKLGEVGAAVTDVKTDLGQTKSELEKTIASLKRVQGDLSSQGSLIATNSNELAALKALGERNYYEFRIKKSKEPQRVGDIALVLKKTDQKKNRYTVDLLVDDKRIEKKDKTINEPVQFMVSKARQPYELVVNEVTKNQIAGYLATPKVQTVRN
jgi:multidrug efflux pump subunit AcrA (membrane-fusion protein)